jgi:hypothetical protein
MAAMPPPLTLDTPADDFGLPGTSSAAAKCMTSAARWSGMSIPHWDGPMRHRTASHLGRSKRYETVRCKGLEANEMLLHARLGTDRGRRGISPIGVFGFLQPKSPRPQRVVNRCSTQ